MKSVCEEDHFARGVPGPRRTQTAPRRETRLRVPSAQSWSEHCRSIVWRCENSWLHQNPRRKRQPEFGNKINITTSARQIGPLTLSQGLGNRKRNSSTQQNLQPKKPPDPPES